MLLCTSDNQGFTQVLDQPPTGMRQPHASAHFRAVDEYLMRQPHESAHCRAVVYANETTARRCCPTAHSSMPVGGWFNTCVIDRWRCDDWRIVAGHPQRPQLQAQHRLHAHNHRPRSRRPGAVIQGNRMCNSHQHQR